jgi:hypothetical protein
MLFYPWIDSHRVDKMDRQFACNKALVEPQDNNGKLSVTLPNCANKNSVLHISQGESKFENPNIESSQNSMEKLT